MNKKIGTSSIMYSLDGRVMDALFIPDMEVKPDEKVLSELKAIDCDATNPESIRLNSEKVMAHWLLNAQSFIDQVEDFDREKFKLTSKVAVCDKYAGTEQVRLCMIEFSIEEIKPVVV